MPRCRYAVHTFLWTVVLASALTCAAQRSAADTIVGQYAANYVALQASAQSWYRGATSVADVSSPPDQPFGMAAPAYEPHPPYLNVITATSVPLAPAFGLTKDTATGSMMVAFAFGSGPTNDQINFHFTGSASASLSALNSLGEPVGALVVSSALVNFSIDPRGGASPGDIVGFLILHPLPATGAFETVNGSVSVGGLPTALPAAGGSDLSMPLVAGSPYAIAVNYKLSVPNGVDPAGAYDYTIDIAPASVVPEPASLGFLSIGVVAILARRRGARK